MKVIFTISLIILFLVGNNTYAQKRKFRPLIGTQHEKNSDVYGLSLGFYPTQSNYKNLNRTYGARLEIFPLSFLYFLASKVPEIQEVNHKIYGINLSTGTFQGIDIYGISTTLFMNNIKHSNGISLAGLTNSIEKGNGIMIAFGGNGIKKGNGIMISGPYGGYSENFNGIQISFENYSTKINGIQIGLFNKTKNLKGIQIGLWNKNKKRTLPFINWNF